jgi:hypothetical protein
MKIRLLPLIATFVPAITIFTAALVLGQIYKAFESYSHETQASVLESKSVIEDNRVKSLELFFSKFNSPLKPHSDTFVEVADKYGLDYRLLPAIACMESTCGKYLIPGTYNPFGWGIYGTNYISFDNYEQAIDTVGKGLKDNYLSRGFDTPAKIAPIYTPPRHQHWLSGVTWFMNKIDEAAKLPVS